MKARLLLPAAVLLLAPGALQAQDPTVPVFLNYQGTVTDANGLPLGATGTAEAPVAAPENRKVLFRIYSTATGGTSLWTEQQTVTISLGQFSVLLGNGIDPTGTAAGEAHGPLADVFTSAAGGSAEGPIRYLELTVDDGNDTIGAEDKKISPRQRITTTAYSFVAKRADSMKGGTIENSTFTGTNKFTGGTFTGGTFTGNGAGLTALGGANIVDGTVTAAKLGSDVGFWSVSGGNVYRNSGNVGIGNSNPNYPLTLQASGIEWLSLRNSAAQTKWVLQNGNAGTGLEIVEDGVANNRLFIKEGSGNVGIGTGSPNQKLDVAGNATISGNVGIGTGSPSQKLDVVGDATISGNVGIGAATPGFPLTFADTLGDKISLYGQAGDSWGFGIQGGVMQIHSDGVGGDIAFGYGSSAAMTETMRIKGNGNVGIGTASPTAKLDVAGTVKATNFSGNGGGLAGVVDLTSNQSIGGTKTFADNINLGTSAGDYQHLRIGGGNSSGFLYGSFPYYADGIHLGYNFYADSAGHHVIPNAGGGTSRISFDFGNIDFAIGAVNTAPTSKMHISLAGNVGIGTTTPTKAKLEISGFVTTSVGEGPYLAESVGGDGVEENNPAGNKSLSVYASDDIAANAVKSFSDERIKRIEGRSDGRQDLVTLLDIEITDYAHIDTISKGAGKHKKVVAQQVEATFPQAVSRHTDVVPDIYRKGKFVGGWIQVATDLKKGDRVRLIGEKEEGIHEVLEVREGAFRTAFQPATEKVFVYGREVNDFRTVDYDAIAMLNVSATQEIKREKDAEVAALQKENSELRARLEALEAKDQARDAKLAAIEEMLRSAEEPAARKVSLTTAVGVE